MICLYLWDIESQTASGDKKSRDFKHIYRSYDNLYLKSGPTQQ